MAVGLVLWGVKSIYYVLDNETQKEYKCLIKGKVLETDFNIKGRREVSPIVVGDQVIFEKVDETNGLIIERKKRTNEFKRLKSNGRLVQTSFANADLLLIVDSITNPPFRPYFIDRCLFTADYMGIPAVIIVNKIDLLEPDMKEYYHEVKSAYQAIGFPVIETSVITRQGLEELKNMVTGKISSFNGRSGVGKSSLIKALDPQYDRIKIGEISKKYDRGIHSTTYAMIYPLSFGAKIIDTPGVRELAVFIDKSDDVENFIRDFNPYRGQCRYPDCQHINEPSCKILEAVEKGLIKDFRYESYLRIRETVQKLDDSRI